MSEGPRIELGKADALAAFLFRRWELDPRLCHVVGSTRRRKDYVGDLEIIAPHQAKTDDDLFSRIAATMDGYVSEGMWEPDPQEPIGRALEGLKPGFKEARLEIRTRSAGAFPVQVFRYTPDNFGWIQLMRTGPGDFGKWFLYRWKERWRIPVGDPGRKASVDGHLVDAEGRVVRVPTEEECFRQCGIAPIAPERRDEFISRVQARSQA